MPHLAIPCERFRPHQLDRRRTGQHTVLGPPDLAHATAAKKLGETVAAQRTGTTHLGSELIDRAGPDVRHEHNQCGVEGHEDEEETRLLRQDGGGAAILHRQCEDDRH